MRKMKQTLFLIGCALAVAGVARGADADGSVLLDGRAWRLSPECRLEGSLLTVTVPKDKARGLHAAVTMVVPCLPRMGGLECGA